MTTHTKNLILNMALRSGSSRVEPIHVYEAMSFRQNHGRMNGHVARFMTCVDLMRIVACLDTLDDGEPVTVELLTGCALVASATVAEAESVRDALGDSLDDYDDAVGTATGIRRWEIRYTDKAGDPQSLTAIAATSDDAVASVINSLDVARVRDDGTVSATVIDTHSVEGQPLAVEYRLSRYAEGGTISNIERGSTFVLDPTTHTAK